MGIEALRGVGGNVSNSTEIWSRVLLGCDIHLCDCMALRSSAVHGGRFTGSETNACHVRAR